MWALKLGRSGGRGLEGVNLGGSWMSVRGYRRNRSIAPTIMEMNRRRDYIRHDQLLRHGKELVQRRSEHIEWNYGVELYAFGARLSEQFDENKLREAFSTHNYVRQEQKRRQDLGLSEEDDGEPSIQSNERLAEVGAKFLEETLLQYTRSALPYLPEEGVEALVKHLMTEKMLSDISFHIGTKDLIMSEEYPPNRATHRQAFLAIVGALLESSGEDRTVAFIQDIVGRQLHVQDINELWDLKDPMGLLTKIFKNEGSEHLPESRLMWASGKETMMACYYVGVYVNQELIGQAAGESADIAEEMAARDALRRLFRTDDARSPIPLGDQARSLKPKKESNTRARDWKRSQDGANNIAHV